MYNDNWIGDINISNGITTTHLQEYTLLWNLTRQIQLRPVHVGQIRWKFTESGSLGVQSAILRIHQRSAPKLIMAHLGEAHSARMCVDLEPFGEARGWEHSPDYPLCVTRRWRRQNIFWRTADTLEEYESTYPLGLSNQIGNRECGDHTHQCRIGGT